MVCAEHQASNNKPHKFTGPAYCMLILSLHRAAKPTRQSTLGHLPIYAILGKKTHTARQIKPYANLRHFGQYNQQSQRGPLVYTITNTTVGTKIDSKHKGNESD